MNASASVVPLRAPPIIHSAIQNVANPQPPAAGQESQGSRRSRLERESREYLAMLCRIVANQYRMSVMFSDEADTFAIAKMDSGDYMIIISTKLLAFESGDDRRVRILIDGAVSHEAIGHGRFTTFAKNMGKWTPFKATLVNALEDPRIERLAATVYVRSGLMLAEMSQILDTEGFWKLDPDAVEESILLTGLLRRHRTQQLGQALDLVVNQQFEDAMVQAFTQPVMDQINPLAWKAFDAKSTAEVEAIADEIIKILEKNCPNFSQNIGGQVDIEHGVATIMKKIADRNGSSDIRIGIMKDESAGEADGKGDTGGGRSPTGDAKDGNGDVPTAGNARRLLQRKIEKIFASQEEDVEEMEARQGPELNSRSLAMIASGLETRPFMVEDEIIRPGLDTDVALYVDSSGSITSTIGRPFMAEMIVAFGAAFQKFRPRARLRIARFSGDSAYLYDSQAEVWSKACYRVVSRYEPSGGTDWMSGGPDLMARLAASKRKRKVMVTLTDGLLGPVDEIDKLIASGHSHHGIESMIISMGEGAFNGLATEVHVPDLDPLHVVSALMGQLALKL